MSNKDIKPQSWFTLYETQTPQTGMDALFAYYVQKIYDNINEDNKNNLFLLSYKRVLVERFLTRLPSLFYGYSPDIKLFIKAYNDQNENINDDADDNNMIIIQDFINGSNEFRDNIPSIQFPFHKGLNHYNTQMASILRSFMIFMPCWLFCVFPIQYWYTITFSLMIRQFITNESNFGCVKDVDACSLFPDIYHEALKECDEMISDTNNEKNKKNTPLLRQDNHHYIHYALVKIRERQLFINNKNYFYDSLVTILTKTLNMKGILVKSNYKTYIIKTDDADNDKKSIIDVLLKNNNFFPFVYSESKYEKVFKNGDRKKTIKYTIDKINTNNDNKTYITLPTIIDKSSPGCINIRPFEKIYHSIIQLFNYETLYSVKTNDGDGINFSNTLDKEKLYICFNTNDLKDRLNSLIQSLIHNDIMKGSKVHERSSAIAHLASIRYYQKSLPYYLKYVKSVQDGYIIYNDQISNQSSIKSQLTIINNVILKRDTINNSNGSPQLLLLNLEKAFIYETMNQELVV